MKRYLVTLDYPLFAYVADGKARSIYRVCCKSSPVHRLQMPEHILNRWIPVRVGKN